MKDCIFCHIVNGKLPAKIAYKDDLVVAFHDINPRSDVHLLVVPKKHIVDLRETKKRDDPVLGRMLSVTRTLAEKLGFGRGGYQVMISNGQEAGQEVMHLHVHVLSGRGIGFLR